MNDIDREQLRRDRVMRQARNVVIKEVGADLKYVSHKPYAGTNEIDKNTPAYTTRAEYVSMALNLLHRGDSNTVGRGEFRCELCQMVCAVRDGYRMKVVRGERRPVCTDCLEEM